MTTLYFVRHAEVEYIPDDFLRPLSEKGRQQALGVTRFFKNTQIDAILSSPYKRAIDTIAGIALARNLDIETHSELRERHVAEEPVEDFAAFTKQQWADFDFKLETGESLRETQKRGMAALEHILLKYQGQTVVIGTHGTILAMILHRFKPEFSHEDWKNMKMPCVVRMVFDEVGVLMAIELTNEVF